MAMTAGERKKIVKDLEGDWWRLDRMIPDDNERAQFVWDVAREGLVADVYFCNTLGNYYDPAHTKTAVDFLGRVADKVDDYQQHRGIKGWDHSFEWLVTRMAEDDPQGLLAAKDQLPPLFRDFSLLFLAHGGAKTGALPLSAKRRLAISWASSTWDDDWYDVRDQISQDEWTKLVLESICAPDVSSVEWDRIEPLLQNATVAQRIAVITKDHGQHVRAHAAAALAGLEPADFAAVRAAIDALDPEAEYSAMTQRGALLGALVAAYGRAGESVPEGLVALMRADLDWYGDEDPETTVAALEALPLQTRESLVREAVEMDTHSYPRVMAVAHAAPTLAVLEAVLQRVERCGQGSDVIERTLAGFGQLAVEPLLERLSKKLSAAVGEMYVHAIDRIGAPEAAEALVELTGASTKGTRVAASTALENLGVAAIEAVRAGTEAKKKAIREACSALLAQLEMAGENPLADLEKRAEQLDDPALDALFVELRRANMQSSDDYEKFADFTTKHGILLALRVRDFFLESPEDWYRSTLWRGALEGFSDEPNIAWVAVDAFSKLPAKMYSYYVDQQAGELNRIAAKRPEEAGKAIVYYLKGSPPEFRAQMLETLLQCAPKTDVDVYIAAMQDTSKVVRALGIRGIAQYGVEQLPAVLELLGSRKKDVRLAAAEALTMIPAASARAEIEAALAAEKTADVRTLLEQAVAAAGGSAFEFPGDDGSKVTDADIDAFLTGLNQPKLPSFVDLGALSLTYAASGERLSEKALHALVGRLMKEDPDNLDEVARRVRPYLDDASANAFSVALKDAWAESGGASKEKWAIFQQGILASAERLDEVAPQLDEMAAFSNHHLAKWYLEVLYRHGSRAAHSWLVYWAKNGERSSVVETAQACLERAANDAGKDVEVYATSLNSYIADDVADRNVPRLGLDEPFVVDYGERKFEVRMDQNHNLVIRDVDEQKTYKSLPKPRKAETLDDDLKAHVTELKKRLRSVVRDVSGRLEAGMISGRPWTAAAFEELFGSHPIMTPFAGRLVFRADDGTLFRVSEGELLNADYDTVSLKPDQTVRIAHPLELSADELDQWGEHFADAEIMQPFDQLGRPTYSKEDAIPLGKTTRGAVAGRLRRLGWRKGWAEDAGMVYTASRLLAGRGVRAWLEHGGFYVGDPSWDADEEIDVSSVWFHDLEGQNLEIEDVDPLAYSEIVLELTQLLA